MPHTAADSLLAKLEEIPDMPTSLFKRLELASTQKPILTLQSSGTTGQQPSRIIVDAETSERQSRGLRLDLPDHLGAKRIPLLAIDTRKVVTDQRTLTARGAGVLGMMKFGAKTTFALDADLNVIDEEVLAFVEKHKGQPFLIFGFTFLVWLKLVKHFEGSDLDLSNAVIVHSGGWKKTGREKRVSNEVFRARIGELFGTTRIYNFMRLRRAARLCLSGSRGRAPLRAELRRHHRARSEDVRAAPSRPDRTASGGLASPPSPTRVTPS